MAAREMYRVFPIWRTRVPDNYTHAKAPIVDEGSLMLLSQMENCIKCHTQYKLKGITSYSSSGCSRRECLKTGTT